MAFRLVDNSSMSFEIGSQVNLSYINRKPERKTSAQSVGNFLVEIGTAFKLRATQDGYVACRIIPVVAL